MKTVVSVRFKPTGKIYYFDPAGFEIPTGSHVMVETSRGAECGEVAHGNHELADSQVPKELKPVQRLADDADVRRMRKNREEEHSAFKLAEERIEKRELPMKLTDVECVFDRSKIIFYFVADSRVDFRALVRDLAAALHTRIEMRQIGVRDEAKMLGGLGLCGQPFCCSRFLKGFQPVSIKMAKEQGLSLNPTKISGSCGRLMCCLAYEQPAYEYLNKVTPGLGSVVETPGGTAIVTEVNLITGLLKVRPEMPGEGGVRYYKRSEIKYLRGGKRAPQPADPAYEEATMYSEEDEA